MCGPQSLEFVLAFRKDLPLMLMEQPQSLDAQKSQCLLQMYLLLKLVSLVNSCSETS